MTAFADLSPEGKRQKLLQHLDTGHPVPAPWVRWLILQPVPDMDSLAREAVAAGVSRSSFAQEAEYAHDQAADGER